MKKKNLKYLTLHKYSVSNLALLHRKTGGIIVTNTESQTDVIPYDQTVYNTDCFYGNTNTFVVSDCGATLCVRECHTNGGTTRVQPPSEHQGCNINTDATHIFNG